MDSDSSVSHGRLAFWIRVWCYERLAMTLHYPRVMIRGPERVKHCDIVLVGQFVALSECLYIKTFLLSRFSGMRRIQMAHRCNDKMVIAFSRRFCTTEYTTGLE